MLNALSKAAFACLWCFVFVLPWDVYAELPVVGSIPRLVGIVASTVGALYICARRRVSASPPERSQCSFAEDSRNTV